MVSKLDIGGTTNFSNRHNFSSKCLFLRVSESSTGRVMDSVPDRRSTGNKIPNRKPKICLLEASHFFIKLYRHLLSLAHQYVRLEWGLLLKARQNLWKAHLLKRKQLWINIKGNGCFNNDFHCQKNWTSISFQYHLSSPQERW